MTLLEKLREEGKVEGTTIAIKLFNKFGKSGVSLLEEIQQKDPKLLDNLSKIMEEADTIEELRKTLYKNHN